MALRECLTCGALSPGTRCPQHTLTTHQRYGSEWKGISQATIAASPQCEVCGATTGLTADHLYPFALGGGHDETNLRVLCRSCQGKYGSTKARPRGRRPGSTV